MLPCMWLGAWVCSVICVLPCMRDATSSRSLLASIGVCVTSLFCTLGATVPAQHPILSHEAVSCQRCSYLGQIIKTQAHKLVHIIRSSSSTSTPTSAGKPDKVHIEESMLRLEGTVSATANTAWMRCSATLVPNMHVCTLFGKSGDEGAAPPAAL